jgi:hypothetical protein
MCLRYPISTHAVGTKKASSRRAAGSRTRWGDCVMPKKPFADCIRSVSRIHYSRFKAAMSELCRYGWSKRLCEVGLPSLDTHPRRPQRESGQAGKQDNIPCNVDQGKCVFASRRCVCDARSAYLHETRRAQRREQGRDSSNLDFCQM